jgi:nucleotide-binding universal stress UspA family protein
MPTTVEEEKQTVEPEKNSIARILVPVDFSPASLNAAVYARCFAQPFGSEIFIANMVPQPKPLIAPNGGPVDTDFLRASLEMARHRMIALEQNIASSENCLTIRTVLGRGSVEEGLQALIENRNIDLVVMSTRGRRGLSKLLLGSVAAWLLRNTPIPIVALGPKVIVSHTGAPKRITCFVNPTSKGRETYVFAKKIAAGFYATLVLFYVPDPAVTELMAPATRTGLADYYRELLIRTLGIAENNPPDIHIDAGPASQAFSNAVTTLDADLLVLGIENATPDEWRLAYKMVARAPSPVAILTHARDHNPKENR